MSYGVVAILGPFVVLLPLLAWAGGRFAKRRRAEGAWDARGPKAPTDPPPDFLRPRARRFPLEMGSLRWAENHGRRFRFPWWK